MYRLMGGRPAAGSTVSTGPSAAWAGTPVTPAPATMAATAVARTRTFRLHCMAANLLNEGWERSHGDSAVPGRVSRSLCGHARPHIAELRRDRPRRPGAAEIFHAFQDGAGPGASRGWLRAAAMPAPMQAVQMVRG